MVSRSWGKTLAMFRYIESHHMPEDVILFIGADGQKFLWQKGEAMEEMKDPYDEYQKAETDKKAATAMNQSVHVHEKEDIEFLRPRGPHLPYSGVTIESVPNGYGVSIGCKTFYIDSRERLIRLLRRYLNDPEGMISEVIPFERPQEPQEVAQSAAPPPHFGEMGQRAGLRFQGADRARDMAACPESACCNEIPPPRPEPDPFQG